MKDECPICYNAKQNCTIICQHSFCYKCIKEWYSQSLNTPSCPICRRNIYFKGMYKSKSKLKNEQKETRTQKCFEKYLEYILSNITIFTPFYIKYISQQLYNINTYRQIFNEDDIDILLCYYITENKQRKLFDSFNKRKSKSTNIIKKYNRKKCYEYKHLHNHIRFQ